MSALPDRTVAAAASPTANVEPPRDVGGASTAVTCDEILVLLTGEVDLALSGVLGDILSQVPGSGARAVVDASAVTFADCTLLAFLTQLSELARLVLKPSAAVRDLLLLGGLPSDFGQDG
jgi:anti-anti-sigma regulatory factor